jgi:cytochrome c-type biogenesis protein CcsB
MSVLLLVGLPVVMAGLFILLQWKGTITQLESETSLVVVALINYIGASVFSLAFLYQRESLLERLATLTASVGFGLNLAAWGTHGLIVGYFPMSNLYDTSLVFGMATACASVVIASGYRHRFIGALTMPVAMLLLILGLLYGNEARDLPPVLVSYWRPIHVGLAMVAYAVCALSFATALLYLLKDKIKLEVVAVFAVLVGVLTYGLISDGSILTSGVMYINLLVEGQRIPLDADNETFLRAGIPYVGHLFRLAFISLFAAGVAFTLFVSIAKENRVRSIAHWLTRLAFVVQAVGVGILMFQLRQPKNAVDLIDAAQRPMIPAQWLQRFGGRLELQLGGGAIEIACMFAALTLTAFVVFFGLKFDRILEAIPSLDALDNLTYRAVTIAFPLLTLMLITGAVWANESWGRYWGWDPKETWALITWLFYATFLHTRITHGWKGRRSAIFAVIGFVSVMFTYLGVSFILPGLHSYA